MSNAVFPTLPGLTFNISKTPDFSGQLVHEAVSGKEIRGSYKVYPKYNFVLSFSVLRATIAFPEFNALSAFYLSRNGSFDSFLFTDWSDNTMLVPVQFGIGDGVTVGFQLTRAWGASGFTFAEPVQNLNGAPQIYINGVLKTAGTDYTINSTGFVTFAVAPGNTLPLTWFGAYYYRCRFKEDTAEFNNFMYTLWELKKIEFIGAPGNRV